MRAKSITDLLSLSVNLYLLSKDEEFMKELRDLAEEGKEKTGQLYDVLTGSKEGDEVIEELLEHIAQLKKNIAGKADEIAKAVYEKIHVAHSSEISRLMHEIEALKSAAAHMEARLNELQQKSN